MTIYIDFECLKTPPPQPMLLGVLTDNGGRGSFEQFAVDESLRAAASLASGVRFASLQTALERVLDRIDPRTGRIVGWSNFDRDVVLRSDVTPAVKEAVRRCYRNALEVARPWRTRIYPSFRIQKTSRFDPKNTLDRFAVLAGYRDVRTLRAGTPAKWIRQVQRALHREDAGRGSSNRAREDWRALLEYNRHDCLALRAIWTKATIELERWRAYENAVYVVDRERGRPIRFRINSANARLDALLERHDASRWVFITAWNPESRALGRRENDRRQAMLAAEVKRLGLASVTGRGQSPDWSWPAEESLLVLGLSKKAGRELGRRFGQFAIVAGRRGGRARLVRCASQPRA